MYVTFSKLVVVAVLMVGTFGCQSKRELDVNQFENVTTAVGIHFKHDTGMHEQQYFMPRSVGSGAAFLDYDNDGLLDVLLLQNGGPGSGHTNRLYRQLAGNVFEDKSKGSGLDVDGYAMGVAVGDINNDGFADVLITEYGRSRLFLNETVSSEPKFADVSLIATLDNNAWATSCCFVDYDRDGWLDMLLVNYLSYDPSRWCADGGGRQEFCGPDAFVGQPTKLYRNLGDVNGDGVGDTKFEDVTISSGLSKHPGPGLGVFCADFDGDRWVDIFIANDGKPNHLWMNQQDGTFSEEAMIRGVGFNNMGKSEADMGVAFGDVNRDGFFDLFVTHLASETHTLWRQGPRGIFSDKTATSGLTSTKWRGTGFGTAMFDLDNDSDLDLAIANGRVTRTATEIEKMSDDLDPFWHPYAERDQIILNDGSGNFIDVSVQNSAFSEIGTVSRGLACADYNNDGAIDLLVTRIAGPSGLYKNLNRSSHHWLMIRALDPALKRDAYGAEVYIYSGGKKMMRWINPGYSYLCSNDVRAHFGLGKVATVEKIEVIWPDGQLEFFPGCKVNQQLTLIKGTGKSNENDLAMQIAP